MRGSNRRMQGAMQARIQSLYNSPHFGERAGRFLQLSSASVTGQKAKYSLRAHIVRFAPESGLKSDIAGGPFRAKGLSDVPRQAPNARLIALLLPFWLEGLGDRSCRGEGGT